ncbi:MAG TPA: hypothetical protein V6D37_08720 [Candidatus Sericytochromatia bacterium]
MKHIPHSNQHKQSVLAALVFTSIISLGAGLSLVDSATAKSLKPPQDAVSFKQFGDNDIPVGVVTAVSREISRTYRVSQNQLKVVSATQQSWSDSCLGLGQANESCLRAEVKDGWRVVMSDSRQTWTYRTDGTGRAVRLESQGNSNNSKLPNSVADLALRTASQRTGLRTSELRIVKSEQITVDGCLGLPRPGEACTRISQQAWEVTVEGGKQRLVYRTNQNATLIRLNEAASNVTDSNLPQIISRAVLRVASTDFGVSSSQLRITKAEQQTWGDGCLGLPRPTERCMGTPTPGWRVTVVGRQRVQVYRTDTSGERIRAEQITGQIPGNNNLPNSVSDAVLRDAARRSNLSISQLRIVQAEKRDWPNGCLGIIEPGRSCAAMVVSGWRVRVEGGRQTFVYRTNESGSVVKVETGVIQGSIRPVQIPRSEISPLAEGMVFRTISSGGIAGTTTETFLMNDGRVMRLSGRFTSSMIPTATQISRISRQEVRQFERLLEQQQFSQFDRLSYPAPRGAADFFTVTLTSESGTTRYGDIVQDELPESLRSVILAWNQIVSRR